MTGGPSDTSPEVERLHHELLMARSPGERLRMGLGWSAMLRSLALASIRAQHPEATPAEVRQRLFLRYYGDEFAEPQRSAVLRRIAETSPAQWPPDEA